MECHYVIIRFWETLVSNMDGLFSWIYSVPFQFMTHRPNIRRCVT